MEYSIVRSSRRTLAVEITRDGEVIVRAPCRCPKGHIESFVASKDEWIQSHVKLQKARMALHPEPDEAGQLELIEKARALLPEKVERYGKMMGLCPTGITITGARTRFGSCSPKNRLSFSWRLMDFPDEAVDYVVVHELAHLVHRNHGAEFYELIAAILPDYKQRKALLRG